MKAKLTCQLIEYRKLLLPALVVVVAALSWYLRGG